MGPIRNILILSQKAILNNAAKRSFRRYSRCGIVGFHFSYSVAGCIIDGMLFVSTEYILILENPKQMHPTCGKTAQRNRGIVGFHFSYSVAGCIIDGMLFVSPE